MPIPDRATLPGRSRLFYRGADRVFWLMAGAAGAGILLLLMWLAGALGQISLPALTTFGPLRFLLSTEWNPVESEFGALPFIFGTVVSAMLALLLAVPVALGVAIFLTELAPGWLRQPISFLVEVLAAIPSVIYGLWGIFVLIPLIRVVEGWLGKYLGFIPLFSGPPLGFGLLAAGSVLAVMILPTIAAVSREVLSAVPSHQREASLALGATRWESIWQVVLPYGRSGLLGAGLLGLGRALGETMAVTMVIGNRPEISASLFAPAYTLSSVIANEFAEATGNLQLGSLTAMGLILFGVTLLLNILARTMVGRMGLVERRGILGGRG